MAKFKLSCFCESVISSPKYIPLESIVSGCMKLMILLKKYLKNTFINLEQKGIFHNMWQVFYQMRIPSPIFWYKSPPSDSSGSRWEQSSSHSRLLLIHWANDLSSSCGTSKITGSGGSEKELKPDFFSLKEHLNQNHIQVLKVICHSHIVILRYWTLKKWACSNFAFQYC